LARKAHGANQIQRFSPKNNTALSNYKHPFWLPAPNYYLAMAVLTLLIFSVVWGILSEGEEELSWLSAIIIALSFSFSGVFLREVLLKNVRKRYLINQKRLDDNLANLRIPHKTDFRDGKLTIEKNTEIIAKIKQMSEAVKVLSHLPEGHYEVFQTCNEYLSLNNKELKAVGAGSPRIVVLIKSRKLIQRMHKFHLLKWAEIQSRLLTSQANQKVKAADKIAKAEKALNVLESALQFYSDETQLIDSRDAVNKFIVSINISHLIEQARQSTVEFEYEDAINFYQEALILLSKEDAADDRRHLTDNINQEVEKIRQIEIKKSKIRRFTPEISSRNEHQND
jgi:hypothetical protein